MTPETPLVYDQFLPPKLDIHMAKAMIPTKGEVGVAAGLALASTLVITHPVEAGTLIQEATKAENNVYANAASGIISGGLAVWKETREKPVKPAEVIGNAFLGTLFGVCGMNLAQTLYPNIIKENWGEVLNHIDGIGLTISLGYIIKTTQWAKAKVEDTVAESNKEWRSRSEKIQINRYLGQAHNPFSAGAHAREQLSRLGIEPDKNGNYPKSID